MPDPADSEDGQTHSYGEEVETGLDADRTDGLDVGWMTDTYRQVTDELHGRDRPAGVTVTDQLYHDLR